MMPNERGIDQHDSFNNSKEHEHLLTMDETWINKEPWTILVVIVKLYLYDNKHWTFIY
jgi:hypothetical protein